MINVLLTGVGGQGTVLAAKLLAQAAQAHGWKVRTAETIGMAQRGGSVVSHVRMGNKQEEVHASLLAEGTADLLIAFEPAEAVRCLNYLGEKGICVVARSAVSPVTAALSDAPYQGQNMLDYLQAVLPEKRLVVVNDVHYCAQLGTRKALNTVLLASALHKNALPLNLQDLKDAIGVCVRPQFQELNLKAIRLIEESSDQNTA